MTYAAKTEVPVERSRGEIERTLARYGATAFGYAWGADRAVITFDASDRRVRFAIALPARNERRFTHFTRGGGGSQYARTAAAAEEQWQQACRVRWRALALVVKAKLEAVEAGISEFETEFLAHIVLPSGETAGDWMRPQIAYAYRSGEMPPLLAVGPAS